MLLQLFDVGFEEVDRVVLPLYAKRIDERRGEQVRRYYTVKEAAAILGVSLSLIYSAVQRGEIPSRRIATRILIPAEFIDGK